MAPRCTMQSTRSSTAAGCPAFEALHHERPSFVSSSTQTSWLSTAGTWQSRMLGIRRSWTLANLASTRTCEASPAGFR